MDSLEFALVVIGHLNCFFKRRMMFDVGVIVRINGIEWKNLMLMKIGAVCKQIYYVGSAKKAIL